MPLARSRSAGAAFTSLTSPTGSISAHPVVTLEPPFYHTSTRVQLIGRHPSLADAAEWSVQMHVQDHCPSVFLVQAEDDPISIIANTATLADACHAAGVSVERVLSV